MLSPRPVATRGGRRCLVRSQSATFTHERHFPSGQLSPCRGFSVRYFFDVRDGNTVTRDDFGVELLNSDAAHTEAAIALTEMARDYIPSDGPHRILAIHVRDASGRPQFKVTLEYNVEEERADSPA